MPSPVQLYGTLLKWRDYTQNDFQEPESHHLSALKCAGGQPLYLSRSLLRLPEIERTGHNQLPEVQ